ncbi:ATP-binding protein [Ekhidna sp.]|uniref:AlbA family DNA-binding domain-containing protein n=1 Tax=Ekhidna sp. TaxID=2608089 RepID=UPI00329A64F8
MSLEEEVKAILGQPEGINLEYKAVLPPSRNIAQIISAFANAEGGILILGVHEKPLGGLEINGLSDDFHANSITHKALDLLKPHPSVQYEYVQTNKKKLYAIKVDKSEKIIELEGKVFIRKGSSIIFSNPPEQHFRTDGFNEIKRINELLENYKNDSTSSKKKLIEHYQSILKIFDDLGIKLYPVSPSHPTTDSEGKILTRILFSSIADNFENYLSDLLYEIFLANPSTLKSKKEVTIEEVLNCTDLQEFVKYWAKKQLLGLQKGSVKGFIEENKQIRDLKVIDNDRQSEIEKILQVRHLYSHRNGLVDEKFLQYFDGYSLNEEFQLTMEQMCSKLEYLATIVNEIDLKAIEKHKLALSD